jgi:hypothetical protein
MKIDKEKKHMNIIEVCFTIKDGEDYARYIYGKEKRYYVSSIAYF